MVCLIRATVTVEFLCRLKKNTNSKNQLTQILSSPQYSWLRHFWSQCPHVLLLLLHISGIETKDASYMYVNLITVAR